MKQFKKFAAALIAVVVILVIGLFTKRYWGPVAWYFVAWICSSVGVTAPSGLKSLLDSTVSYSA